MLFVQIDNAGSSCVCSSLSQASCSYYRSGQQRIVRSDLFRPRQRATARLISAYDFGVQSRPEQTVLSVTNRFRCKKLFYAPNIYASRLLSQDNENAWHWSIIWSKTGPQKTGRYSARIALSGGIARLVGKHVFAGSATTIDERLISAAFARRR